MEGRGKSLRGGKRQWKEEGQGERQRGDRERGGDKQTKPEKRVESQITKAGIEIAPFCHSGLSRTGNIRREDFKKGVNAVEFGTLMEIDSDKSRHFRKKEDFRTPIPMHKEN